MKIKIEFEAESPLQAYQVLGDVRRQIMHEFNPGEWKRSAVLEFLALTPTVRVAFKMEK